MNVTESLIEGMIKRGVKEGIDTSRFTSYLKPGQIIPISKGGFNKEAVDAAGNVIEDWGKITLGGYDVPVSQMPFDEFAKPNNIEDLIGNHKWRAKGQISRYLDPMFERAGLDKVFKDAKKIAKAYGQKGVGTSQARITKDIPPHVYKIIKDIEQTAFDTPIDKLTAEFMNITGHRGPETARLNIENFSKQLATEKGGSYGQKWNLYAKGWEMKEGSKKIKHFSPLAKVVIYNALLLAEKEGRTSGPLFPNAKIVEETIGNNLGARLGKLAGYTEGIGSKTFEAGRTLYRNLAKAAIRSTGSVEKYSGKIWNDWRLALEGGKKLSTGTGYFVVGDIESSINDIGRVIDDQYIALSDHRSPEAWTKKNGYEVPKELKEYIPNKVDPKNIAPRKYFLGWMTDRLKSIYQSGKVFTSDIPTTDVDKQQILLEEANEAAKTKVDTEKSLYDTYKTGEINKKTAIEDLMKNEGLTENEAIRKYDKILKGTVVDKVPEKGRGAFGKALDAIVDSKLGKGAKFIAPFVPYVGAAWMTDVVVKSGKEAFEEEEDIAYEPVYPGALTRIKRDSETMPKAAIRFGSEALGRDPEADLQAARIAEEWVSPIPATTIPMQGEEIVPFGEAISGQIRKLFPEDFNIGGIRGR